MKSDLFNKRDIRTKNNIPCDLIGFNQVKLTKMGAATYMKQISDKNSLLLLSSRYLVIEY
jgi:hypothetical protein